MSDFDQLTADLTPKWQRLISILLANRIHPIGFVAIHFPSRRLNLVVVPVTPSNADNTASQWSAALSSAIRNRILPLTLISFSSKRGHLGAHYYPPAMDYAKVTEQEIETVIRRAITIEPIVPPPIFKPQPKQEAIHVPLCLN